MRYFILISLFISAIFAAVTGKSSADDLTTSTPSAYANPGQRFDIVKSSRVQEGWMNWSWGVDGSSSTNDGLVSYLIPGEWGGVSFRRSDDIELGAGTLYFKAKSDDSNAQVQILLHRSDNDDYASVGTVRNIPTNRLGSYSVEIKSSIGSFNRLSFQDGRNNGLTLTLNDIYFVAAGSSNNNSNGNTSQNTNTQNTNSNSKIVIVNEGERNLQSPWMDWSWGVERKGYDRDNNLVYYITAGEWGGASFKREDNVFIGEGTLYFKAKTDDANAMIQVILHDSQSDDYFTAGSVTKVSTTGMTQYSVTIKPQRRNGKYDRITFQDGRNNGLILYLTDVYFVSGSIATAPIKTTTTRTTTTVKVTTTTVKVATTTASAATNAGKTYYIIKEGTSKVDSAWENWSWAADERKFDSNGNLISYITAENWGAVSFKRNDNVKFDKGALYFKARTNDTSAVLQVLVHVVDSDNIVNIGTVRNIPTNKMTKYGVQISNLSGQFDRISFQDINNRGLTLYLNDVYFVANDASTPGKKPTTTTTTTEKKTTTTTTTTTVEKKTTTTVTTTTTTTVPKPTGDLIEILKSGSINSSWEDWSWGLSSSKFDSNGNLVSVLNANDFAAVSFRRTDTLKFGKGTLQFKAKSSVKNASIQIVCHLSKYDDFVLVKEVKNIATDKMEEYTININEPKGDKYNRISFLDINGVGMTLTLGDVNFYSASTVVVSSAVSEDVASKVDDTKSTTTTTTTVASTPSSTSDKKAECTSYSKGYEACGGKNYPDASPCCEEGYTCQVLNDYFHMCVLDN